jgi:hypothetical protein
MAYKTPNPVQKISGYVEQGSATVTTTNNQTVKVPKTYAGARIEFFHAGTNAHARFYDEDGNDLETTFIQSNLDGFYSFHAETGHYYLKFIDPASPPEEPVEVAARKDIKVESRTYNVRDYGAKGDAMTDDTQAIQAALAAMIVANFEGQTNGVGTLFFPSGRYLVNTENDGFFDLPSGIIIQGTAGPVTGAAASNCQIILTSEDSKLFRIRTNRSKITIRDIGLTATLGIDSRNIAIDAREDVINQNTYNIEFNNVTIWNYWRGISIESAHITDPHTGTLEEWDITNVKIDHCTISDSLTCIYINSQNSDFIKITDSRIGAEPAGFGIYLEKVGIITIDNVLGAGATDQTPQHNPISDTFIFITAGHGTVTVTGCECEGFMNSMQIVPLNVGNFSWPILLLNNTFGNPVRLNSQCEFISIGNRYAADTVQCNAQASATIYSLGDVLRDLDKPPEVGEFELNQGLSRLASRANQYRVDFQRPARFGGKAGLIADRLENVSLAIAPLNDNAGEAQTQLALCNSEGKPLFNVRADASYLYFEDERSHQLIMRLDRAGNLAIHGHLSEGGI